MSVYWCYKMLPDKLMFSEVNKLDQLTFNDYLEEV